MFGWSCLHSSHVLCSVKCIACYLSSTCNKCVDLCVTCLFLLKFMLMQECSLLKWWLRWSQQKQKLCVAQMHLHVLPVLQRSMLGYYHLMNEELPALRDIRLYMNIKASFIWPWVPVSSISSKINWIRYWVQSYFRVTMILLDVACSASLQ